LPPCSIFLDHEKVYEDSIWSGKWSQPPLQPNTRQNEFCTSMALVGSDKQGDRTNQDSSRYTVTKAAGNSFSQTPARLTVGHLCPWLVLPWLALACLALGKG
jgi:hypothetical protein